MLLRPPLDLAADPAQFPGQLRPVAWDVLSITFRIRQTTGLRSLASASQPSRSVSNGIEPPPANGSTTRGDSSPWAAFTKPRLTSRYVRLLANSQLAKSAMNVRMIFRSPLSDSTGLCSSLHIPPYVVCRNCSFKED